MTTSPSESASEDAARAPSREALDARVEALRAELEAESARPRQAVLRYELAHTLEQIGQEAVAVKEHLTAYNLDPSFRLPLFALLRIFERRRSIKNLDRLYDAELRSATSDREKSSALIDRGVLAIDHLGQPDQGRTFLAEAAETDPTSASAALMLEHAALGAGDEATAAATTEARARATVDPTLRGQLLCEVARHRESSGDVDGAIGLLQEAAALPTGRYRTLLHLERIARKHGRTAELVAALDARAALTAAGARGEEAGQASGAFGVQRFPDVEAAKGLAVALWHESARLRLALLADAAGAVRALDQALVVAPADILLRKAHMLASELAGDLETAAADANVLIAGGVPGRHAAALHFRLAELAQVRQDAEGSLAALEAALTADPGSAAARAMLEDLLLDLGRHDDRVARLRARGQDASLSGAARARALWRAAQIASTRGDFAEARAVYDQAVALAGDKAAILRELYGVALRRGELYTARDAAAALVLQPIDDEERGALLHEMIELHLGLGDPAAADAALRGALEAPAADLWSADAARIHGAATGDLDLLTRAHRKLAERAPDPEATAAHLCAAARARLRSDDEEAAMGLLRSALEAVPGHRYAVAALEEILRARGDAEAVVMLLREASIAQAGARAAELSLLLAGAAAEAAGDTALAVRTYDEAAERDATAVAPFYSLRRLAERTKDKALLLRAREGLAAREQAAGAAGRAALELAEHYDLVADEPARAVGPLRAALLSDAVGPSAALDLVLLDAKASDPEATLAALEQLSEAVGEMDQPGILRALAFTAIAAGDRKRAEKVTGPLTGGREAWVQYAHLRAIGADPERAADRAAAWIALGSIIEDEDTAAELVLHGLRAKTIALGPDAADDAVILAHEAAAVAPDSPAAAVALDETLESSDDPETRVEALAGRLAHVGPAGRLSLSSAHGRALTAAGRAAEAVASLSAVVADDPGDLASHEALRVAAREVEEWRLVVRSCDALAAAASGQFKAQLLEEGAAILMDHLDDDDGARHRLAQALEVEASRPIAYGRLHDLLAEGEDTAGLLDLVTRRLDVVNDSAELSRLFYEQARLLRAEGDREGALDAIESLLMLDEQHVGGLALAVEIHTTLERWSDAVDALRAIASADVPQKQMRLARLGAADFLEKKLGDAPGALEELRAIEEIGLADPALYARIASVAERAGLYGDAATALEQAAAQSDGAEQAGHLREAARLLVGPLGDRDGALDAYQRALAAEPDDAESAGALAELLVEPLERDAALGAFERALRGRLGAFPADVPALRKLRSVAGWRRDHVLEQAALGEIVALGTPTVEERDSHAPAAQLRRDGPTGVIGDDGFAVLLAGGGGPAEIARLVSEAMADIDQVEPSRYGAGKGELLSPKVASPLRDETWRIASAFGLPPGGDFYVGGSDPGALIGLPGKKGKPAFIVGASVAAPLDARRRFLLGRLALALRLGTFPLLDRSPADAATLLFAGAAAAEVPLPAGRERPGIDAWIAALKKSLARKHRKAIAEVARQMTDGGASIDAWCATVRRSAARAGLLVASDISVALEALLGPRPDPDRIAATDDALDLLAFHVAPATLALRRALGLVK